MTHNKTWACIKPDGDGCDGDHMTDQPKPRGPLDETEFYTVQEWCSDPHWQKIILSLDSSLRNALAEVECLAKLNEGLSMQNRETHQGMSNLRAQLAQVTQERDEALKDFERWRLNCLNDHALNSEVTELEHSLLAASAENVLMREALDSVLGHHSHSSRCVSTDEAWKCELSAVEQTAKNALSTPPSELTAALSELVEAAERVSSRGWDSCLPKALARVDAALGGK